MIELPLFYLTAIPAVLIVGIAKGGLAGGIGVVGVPLMALTIGPVRAAAIMLPVLMVMDAFALRAWWQRWDPANLRVLLPGAVMGTGIGWATFRYLSADALRVLIGGIALGYAALWFARRGPARVRPASRMRGTFWSTLSGFTSFGVHAGGPPIHVYLLSQQLDKASFQGTTVAFFFVVNWLKVGPYALLGQFDSTNLATALVLAPLAPIGIALGAWLHHRINETVFFRIVYASLALIGTKLIYDGLSA
ncbi:MAG: sulfite exporter TauE/SafE family protein [Gammaproteobacteria bacterium]|nr:sulfite exporter TauE/SafE family protein [Gammaproteobacteria bacterium]